MDTTGMREKAGQYATSVRERFAKAREGEESSGDHVTDIG